jgi:hypothetical protein
VPVRALGGVSGAARRRIAAVVVSLPELVSEISSGALVMLLIDSRPADDPNSCWGQTRADSKVHAHRRPCASAPSRHRRSKLSSRLFVRPNAISRQSAGWRVAAKRNSAKIQVKNCGAWAILPAIVPIYTGQVPAMRIAGFFVPTEPTRPESRPLPRWLGCSATSSASTYASSRKTPSPH